MDLKSLSTSAMSESGVWMDEILNADDIVIPGLRFKVIGRNSKSCKSFGNKLASVMVNKKDARSIKEANDISDKMYIGCVLDWEGMDEGDKAKTALPCTPENIQALFEGAPYIKEQVITFVGADSNFLVK